MTSKNDDNDDDEHADEAYDDDDDDDDYDDDDDDDDGGDDECDHDSDDHDGDDDGDLDCDDDDQYYDGDGDDDATDENDAADATVDDDDQNDEGVEDKDNDVADDEHLLLAILKESEGIAREVLNSHNLDYESVLDLINNEPDNDRIDSQESKISKSTKSKTPALDHFSRDITELAQQKELDPVIGREEEIQRVAQILSRRKKNNPVLIGEPGVGKTAIIEGLGQKIIDKNVPRTLHNKRILSLDLAGLVAGTKYRGQFEERMKTIMLELEKTENLI